MKFLDKWFSKKVRQAWDEANKNCYATEQSISIGAKNTIGASPRSNGMQFTIYPANGGHVLEYQYYDQKADRHNNSLHLITVDQNMGEVIGQAITLEMLKR